MPPESFKDIIDRSIGYGGGKVSKMDFMKMIGKLPCDQNHIVGSLEMEARATAGDGLNPKELPPSKNEEFPSNVSEKPRHHGDENLSALSPSSTEKPIDSILTTEADQVDDGEALCNLEGESMEEISDIYSDLETTVFANDRTSERISQLKQELQKSKQENSECHKRIKELQKDNVNLKRNMSTLLNTAKNEISKKQFILKQLQAKLKDISQKKTGFSPSEVNEITKICCCAEKEFTDSLSTSQLASLINEKLKNYFGDDNKAKAGRIFKFGNMSAYFFKEQIPFKRLKEVTILPLPADSQQAENSLRRDSDIREVSTDNKSAPEDQLSVSATPARTEKEDTKESSVNKNEAQPQSVRSSRSFERGTPGPEHGYHPTSRSSFKERKLHDPVEHEFRNDRYRHHRYGRDRFKPRSRSRSPRDKKSRYHSPSPTPPKRSRYHGHNDRYRVFRREREERHYHRYKSRPHDRERSEFHHHRRRSPSPSPIESQDDRGLDKKKENSTPENSNHVASANSEKDVTNASASSE